MQGLSGNSGTGDPIFMHDDAPCHKGRLVMEFHMKSYGIEAIPWLCNSPYVNPTVNL